MQSAQTEFAPRATSRALRALVLLVSAVLAFAAITVPAPAFAAGPTIAGILHFPTGLDASKNFGSVVLYDEESFDSFGGSVEGYDPESGDATFEVSDLTEGASYIFNYNGPSLGDDPAARGGFTSIQWTDDDNQPVLVAAGTLDLEFTVDATGYVSGVLQFPTGLDPDKKFGYLQNAGGGEEVRHDWINWYGSYDPITGQVPFIGLDYQDLGTVNVSYPGLSGDPANLPSPAGYLPVVSSDTAGGSTDWDSVVGVPVGTDDVVLEMREGAGYTGTITFPSTFDPWPGNASEALYSVAEVSLFGADEQQGTILSYDEFTRSATYVINGVAPGSYHPKVSPYDDYSSKAKPFLSQLSNGAITLEAAENAASAIAASAGELVTADFTVPRPAVIAGTLTQSGAPKGGWTEATIRLAVDGKTTIDGVFVSSSAGTPGTEKYSIAVPAGLHTLTLDVDALTSSKNGTPAFSSHSVISAGSATRAAGSTYKIASKAVARSALVAGTVNWEWPWGDEASPEGFYDSDQSGTVELLKKDGAEWNVAYSDFTRSVYGGRFTWPSLAAGTYKVRVYSDDASYCPVSYYGGPTLETAKQLVIGKTTTVTNVLLEPTVECGALLANRTAISGTQKVGSTLTAAKGRWTAGSTLSYAWFRGTKKVSTKTTYKLTTKDAGAIVTLTVTGSKPGYPAKVVELHTAKILTAATPTISGTASVGKTLTAKPGVWTAGTALTYQWYRGTTAIAGATATTYKLVAADKKKKVSVKVTGTLADYATVTTTSATKTIG
jgi:hypothetical protein